MTSNRTLRASDGHHFSAICREPLHSPPVGGLVLIQEIFGLTTQLDELATHFATRGYRVVAPALYDRVSADSMLDYDRVEEARKLVSQLELDDVLLDISAAAGVASCGGGVGLVGYCWGGGIAYLAACELDVACAVSFYGTRLTAYLGEQPRCPLQFHFGKLDQHIPMADVEKARAANPGQELHIYEKAGHAFANHARPSFHLQSRDLAEQRMFRFIGDCLARPHG